MPQLAQDEQSRIGERRASDSSEVSTCRVSLHALRVEQKHPEVQPPLVVHPRGRRLRPELNATEPQALFPEHSLRGRLAVRRGACAVSVFRHEKFQLLFMRGHKDLLRQNDRHSHSGSP